MNKQGIILSFIILPILILNIFLINILITEKAFADPTIEKFSYDTEFYKSNNIEENKYYERFNINNNIDTFNKLELIKFYNKYTNSSIVSEAIINAALNYNVPINLSFALAWKESRFDINSLNHNFGNSYDYGLYQLNSIYRPTWSKDDFFNITKNAYEGNRYLSYCLDLSDGNIEKALYGYNAGPDAILNNNVPKRSFQYATEIIDYEDFLTVEFNKVF